MSIKSRILVGFWLGVGVSIFALLAVYNNPLWLIGGVVCSGTLAYVVHGITLEG